MDFSLPTDLVAYLRELDAFIEREIKPMEQRDDNMRFFDHRREWARTDFERGGLPRLEWEALLADMKRCADRAGHLRFTLPQAFGGKDGTALETAVIREHLAARGLGLHNDLQNESSIVGSFPWALALRDFGTQEQKDAYIPGLLSGDLVFAFGLTEPEHGSDATWMETAAVRESDGWRITGEKMWNSRVHHAQFDLIFARTSGTRGDASGITCFIVPTSSEGFKVEEFYWTFNMPTDHARISLSDVRVSNDCILGKEGEGLKIAQHFVHENRIRQAASSLGAAQYCINESVKYARKRRPFGKPLAANQAIQWPLVELQTDAAMLRAFIRQTAWEMDRMSKPEVAERLSDKVAMCNYRANRLACQAADQAIQTHGGMGYSRHLPFEHIYRHHRRYRITEGSEEIQMRKVGAHLFGFIGRKSAEEAQ